MIVHVDCNNFFASCELSFHPELEGKPAVVANVNEAGGGVILALNNEAKRIGLKRGNPYFQVKKIIEAQKAVIFPVNHKLYHEVSHRIMSVVTEMGIIQNFIQYSVDEFFGEIPCENVDEIQAHIRKVMSEIWTRTKIPVSCGISITYTLAKAATYFAKHYKGYDGICVITTEKRVKALKQLPIEEVWGIGRKNLPKLLGKNIHTAFDFADRLEGNIRREMNINGYRTWQELNGKTAIDLNGISQQQSIMQSRTFAYMIEDMESLKKLISDYTSACCAKLREQRSVCANVMVFIATNRHRTDLGQYSNSESIKLGTATNDTPTVIKIALMLLERIYKSGFQYKKAGVVLSDITDENNIQLNIFGDNQKIETQRRLMKVTDELNAKFGSEKIHFAIQQDIPLQKKGK
jgi:Nucleotidyltransferase/DNA polymerase involved in DNA repair